MNNIAAKNTANPLIKAVPNVKNVASIAADMAGDEMPSFKDIFSKQIKTSAEGDAEKLQGKAARDVKEVKAEIAAAAATDSNLVINTEVQASGVIDPAQLGLTEGKAEIKTEKEVTADTVVAEVVPQVGAASANTANVIAAPVAAPVSNKLENAASTDTAESAATSVAQTGAQAVPVARHEAKHRVAAEALPDAEANQQPLTVVDDGSPVSGGNLQKVMEDGQDFARNLSNSLAKVAEMQAPTVAAMAPTTLAQLQQTQTEAMPQSNNINTYFGSAGWDKEISQKVVWMVGGAEQSATLTLNPPDLGPVQVVINVNNEYADTTFISDNADVRQALQNGVETLREMMKQSGIELGQTNVSAGNQQKSGFEQAEQARQQMSQSRAGNQAGVSAQEAANPGSATVSRSRALEGLVNTFA